MNVNIPPHPPTPSYVVPGGGTSLYIHMHTFMTVKYRRICWFPDPHPVRQGQQAVAAAFAAAKDAAPSVDDLDEAHMVVYFKTVIISTVGYIYI